MIDRFGIVRPLAAVIVGSVAFAIGVVCALGYNVWADVRPLAFWDVFAENDILDALDGVKPLVGVGDG